MPCSIINTPTGKIFICGPNVEHIPCKECGFYSDYLCDYPVGKEKTCDAKLCNDHAYEVAPNLHYCKSHYNEWIKFKESGGVKKELENVVPFVQAYIRGIKQ